MTIVKAASEQNVYSQIFRPITTARLQAVAEKSGMYSWGDNKFIDFFVSWVGTRPSLGMHSGYRSVFRRTTKSFHRRRDY